jgi:uncharacterized DUF497 family protein
MATISDQQWYPRRFEFRDPGCQVPSSWVQDESLLQDYGLPDNRKTRLLRCKPKLQTRYHKIALTHTKRKGINKIDKRQTKTYNLCMKYLNWNSEKNEILKRERGISFEEIAFLIESGHIIEIEENLGRSNQKLYILEIDNYAIVAPFVENESEIFLKTAFPSRKHAKKFGLKEE